MALAVALILLVVITLVGLAAVSGTILQNKMAANQYDRQIAFQNTASALRIAKQRIMTNPADIWHDCSNGSIQCMADPFDDAALTSADIHTVTVGSAVGTYTAGNLATGQPQYVIESLGLWPNWEHNTGYNQTANSKQYGSNGGAIKASYYRITARSDNPALVGDRAVVTMQAIIKQD